MRKISFFLAFLLSAVCVFAEVQRGYTKSRGRLDENGKLIPGVRLGGVKIETDRGKVVSTLVGDFSLTLNNGRYVLLKVDLDGYVLSDYEQLTSYSYSTEPLAVVLSKPEEYRADQLSAYEKLIETLEENLHQKEDEIFELYEQDKISGKERAELAEKLYKVEETNQKLVQKMAEKYAKIDFDRLDEFRRQVANYIITGQLTKADSLLDTRGSFDKRREEILRQKEIIGERELEIAQERALLEKSKAATRIDIEDFAEDCVNKHEISVIKHQNDSAAYFLELRASIDTTNVKWNNDAGRFIMDYLADFEKAMFYFKRAEKFADGPDLADVYGFQGSVLYKNAKYDKALELFEKCGKICREQLGEESLEMATYYNNLANVYLVMMNFQKAEEYAQKSVDIIFETCEENSEYVAWAYNLAGIFYSNEEKFVESIELYEKSLEIFLSLYNDDYPLLITLYNNISQSKKDLGDYLSAKEYLEKAVILAEKVYGENHPTLADSFFSFGQINVYEEVLDLQSAKEYFQKALAIYKSVFGDNYPTICDIYRHLSLVYNKESDYSKALEYAEKAYGMLPDLEHNGNLKCSCLDALGIIYYSLGNYDKSLETYKELLMLETQIHGDNHTRTATAYSNLGMVYRQLRQLDKARNFYEKSHEIVLNVFGEKHPDVVASYLMLSDISVEEGKYDEAMAGYQKAIAIVKENFPKDVNTLANAYSRMANCYLLSNDIDNALHYFTLALEIFEFVSGEESLDVASTLNDIGYTYESSGDNSKAMTYYEKAYPLMKNLLGENHPKTVDLSVNIAKIEGGKGEYDKALPVFLNAIKVYSGVYGENSEDVATACVLAGNVYAQIQDFENAINYFSKCVEIGESIYGEAYIGIFDVYCYLSSSYFANGNYPKALETMQKVEKICDNNEVPKEVKISCYGALIQIYNALGNMDKVSEYRQKANKI